MTAAATGEAAAAPARATGLRLAYLVSPYPAVSQPFVRREVAALRARGVEVETFSVRRPSAEDVLGTDGAAAAATTTTLRDGRLGPLARAHLRLLARHPTAYATTLLAALRGGPPGRKALLWQAFYWGQAVLLRDVLRARGLRHVHVHFANNAADIARLAVRIDRATGGRLSWSFTMHGPREFLDPVGLDLAAKAADASFVSCITRWCERQILALAPSARTVVVHMGVDPARFAIPRQRRPKEGPLRVLFVGRLVPEKGPADLLAAVGDRADVELVLAGSGPLAADLAAQAAGRARFLGAVSQDELPDRYAWADVLCLPSYAEGLPVVLMEALAAGVPVVTTPIAGIPELVVDRETGLLVEPGDVAGIAAAIDRLADPVLRERLGAAGRARVLAEFDAATAVEPLIAAFARVLA